MLKKIVAAAVLAVILSASARAEIWEIDKVHSSVGFSVRHLVIAKTTGNFTEFTGTVDFDGHDLSRGSVEFTVEMASINTDNAKRDDHLRSADFLDAEKFPTMSFTSKKVIQGKGQEFRLVGDLTIHGISREVAFDCVFFGTITGPMGKTRAGFSAETTINRQDFDVKWSKTFEGGGLVVGNDIKIALEIEVIKNTEMGKL